MSSYARTFVDRVRGHPWAVSGTVVGTVSLAWAALFSTLGVMQFRRFFYHTFDLGIFTQGTWLLSRFKEPFVTARGLNIFADHSSYILYAVVPIYWIFPSAGTLVVVTALAMAVTAPLAWLVARRAGAKPSFAALVGVLVLLQPAVAWQVRDGFHPEVLVVPLIIGAVALLQVDRDGWAIVLTVIALTAKEDVGLLVVPLGIAVVFFMGKKRAGWTIAGLGVFALLLNFYVLLPLWSPTGELLYSYRYEYLGSSAPGIVLGLLTSPSEWVTVFTDGSRIVYVATLLFALPLSFFAPRWLLLGLPMLVANVFSKHGYQYEIEFHYTAYLIVAVVLAAAFGSARVSRISSASLRRGVGLAVAVSAIATANIAAPTSGWAKPHGTQDQIRNILAEIPSDGVVSAWTTLVPSLANREGVYSFPNPWVVTNYGTEGFVEVDKSTVDWVFVRFDSFRDFDYVVDELIESGEFTVVIDDSPFLLLRRSSLDP